MENKINNENKILIEDEKNKLKIIGKNANIKIFLNKDVKNTIESVSLNCSINKTQVELKQEKIMK